MKNTMHPATTSQIVVRSEFSWPAVEMSMLPVWEAAPPMWLIGPVFKVLLIGRELMVGYGRGRGAFRLLFHSCSTRGSGHGVVQL